MTQLLIDTDAFTKLGISGLLGDACTLFSVTLERCARLPALPHMLKRGGLVAVHGKERCDALVPLAEAMPLAPAATTSWLSRLADVPQIDPGEAQLLASVAEHQLFLVTGDKRSLTAVAKVSGMAEALEGRIASLEIVLLALCAKLGSERVRTAVAPLVASKDKTLHVCFSAANKVPEDALRSYVRDLQRAVSPLVLWGLQHVGEV